LGRGAGTQLFNLAGHLGRVNATAFLPSGERVITGSQDGTAKVWSTRDGALIATLISNANGDWLVVTPEGFFSASSPSAASLLSVVGGLRVYSIDQFWQALYRPDLVKEKLAGDPNGKVREAAAQLDLDKILGTGAAPKVSISSHGGENSSDSDLVTVAAEIEDGGGGIGKIEWRINGITVGVSDANEEAGKAPRVSRRQEIALDPGANTIEVVAYNNAGLVASVPAMVKINWAGKQPSAKPHLHVLAVGIDDYHEGKLKLKFGVADASSLAEGFKKAGKELYEDVFVTLALDKEATVAHLDGIFNDLKSRIRPRDVFVFYAAGHGKTEDGRYYFVPQDFKYEAGQSLAHQLSERGIGQDRFQAWFASIPAKKSIVMFDTCESGTLTSEQQVAMNTRGGLEQLAAVGRLIQATGRTTLTAAMDDQPAREGYGGHGVFTFAVLDALARGDRTGNGFIEVTELLEHVDGLVPEITEKTWHMRQVPRSLFQGTNFALARQLPDIAPRAGEEIIISSKPTHVNSEVLQIFKEAGGEGGVVQELPPYTTLTLVKTDEGWALVAKGGKAIGYVLADKLHPLQ
jgi:hypothetical protein